MDFLSRQRFEDFTEQEFLLFIKEFFAETNELQGEELEKYLNDLAVHFDQVAGHPIGYELIYYPDLHGISDSPEAVLETVKEWRTTNGLPGFKE